ncbi:hypothetical protein ACLOJK_004827 [Asimina triloba]
MAGKRGMITIEDLASLRPCFRILDYFELLAPSKGETFSELLEVQGIMLEELEWRQKAILEFLQSQSLKWHSAKGAFFRWCRGLPLHKASRTSPNGELVGHLRGEASGPSLGTRSSSGESLASVFHSSGDRLWLEERPKKRKPFVDGKE